MDALKVSTRAVKSSWWWPTFPEVFSFLALLVVIFLLVALFHYNAIQRQVKKTSRCYQAKQKALVGGKYIVTASNAQNVPIYNVGYDIGARQYSVECACPQGNIPNTIPEVKVYNMQSKRDDYVRDKICNCDKYVYSAGDPIYYSGYPDLLRYMNSGDTTFFTNNLP